MHELAPPIIARVESYDHQQIVAFVERVFDANARMLEPLLDAGPEGLVVVKPNWLAESHGTKLDEWEQVITHPVVVVAVVEVLAARMKGQGTISICDAPITQADFCGIIGRGRFEELLRAVSERWPKLAVEVLDLRREVWTTKDDVVVDRRANEEDPRGYVRLDLGHASTLAGHRGAGRYYGADYDREVVNSHHRGGVHEYLLSGTAVACHLFVNIPKLKTHKKTGLTCCLKNLVGINGDKNWLPHHTEGTPRTGGDEFPNDTLASRIEMRTKAFGQRVALSVPILGSWLYRRVRGVGQRVLGDSDQRVRAGNWSGNDTTWRMVLDLNRALLYGNSDGSWREAGQRKPYLAIVDGIIGGEGSGPATPDAVASAILVGGADPALCDEVACRLMDFEPTDLALIRGAFADHRWPLTEADVGSSPAVDERAEEVRQVRQVRPAVPGGFRPHFGWTELSKETKDGR